MSPARTPSLSDVPKLPEGCLGYLSISGHRSPVVLTGGTMLSGALGLLLLTLLNPVQNRWHDVLLLNPAQWLALLFLVLVCSVLSYFAYNLALSKLDASRVAVYIYFEPVVTVLLG